MNILISGVTGYLGSRIARELANKNHKVIGLLRKNSKGSTSELIKSNIDLYEFEALESNEYFSFVNTVDVVIHTATCYGRDGESENEVFNVNVNFSEKLMIFGILMNSKAFINTDTSLEASVSVYAASKKKFLDRGKRLAKIKNIKFINMKLENFYGPMINKSNFVEILVNSCIKNIESIDLTAGEQVRDFIHIDDVVSAYINVIDNLAKINEQFCEFEIGSGNGISIKSLAIMIKKMLNSSTKLNFGAIPYRKNEGMHSVADISHIENIGWKCHVDLESGISQIINNK